jgi:hypothetical protein
MVPRDSRGTIRVSLVVIVDRRLAVIAANTR